jgi:hypothetical protein
MSSLRVIGAAAFFFLLMCGVPDVRAERINEAAYPYPYKNPLIATSTVLLMQGKEIIPTGDIRDLRIKILEGREHLYLEGKEKLLYRFYQQKGLAPLVFIIPGIGSSSYAGTARYLAEFLAGHGFHVLVLPSPFHWNFAVSASHLGLPGFSGEDAEDLYTVMQLTLNEVKRKWGAKVGKIGLLGLSVGALDAAYISRLDNAQNKIGVFTYLLINPPVDLLRTIRRIDYMADLGSVYGEKQRSYLDAYTVGLLNEALHMDPDNPDYFAGWDTRIGLTDRQIGYLIGNTMQKSVSDALYASDLTLHLGILKSPISWGQRSLRFEEARSYTLMEYLEKFLIFWKQSWGDKQMDLDKLNSQVSLRAIESTLENNKNIFLMHNLDDFLLSDEDIVFLEKTFSKRAIFYPYGGHLGNLWYPKNKTDILAIFSHLFN